jgi:hypothetical protein
MRGLDVTVVPYTGKIFCYSVPTGLLVVSRSGKACVQGNTAINIFGKENYDKEKRKMAKSANFGRLFSFTSLFGA